MSPIKNEISKSAPKCSHDRLRAPMLLGESGLYCLDCPAVLPCPHPRRARVRRARLGELAVAYACGWCGEDF